MKITRYIYLIIMIPVLLASCAKMEDFNLKTFLNDEPIAISHGRFDLGIGYENFYNY